MGARAGGTEDMGVGGWRESHEASRGQSPRPRTAMAMEQKDRETHERRQRWYRLVALSEDHLDTEVNSFREGMRGCRPASLRSGRRAPPSLARQLAGSQCNRACLAVDEEIHYEEGCAAHTEGSYHEVGKGLERPPARADTAVD